jgi:PPOX class probable F420-dependent enzyme
MMPEGTLRFLDATRVGHLATADAHGVPHVVPVCFACTGTTLYITIDAKPKGEVARLKRLRNIAANPRVAFIADRYAEDWTRLGWVMLRGPAVILADGPEHDAAQASLRVRYPQYRAMPIETLPVIAVRIARVTTWGNLSVP